MESSRLSGLCCQYDELLAFLRRYAVDQLSGKSMRRVTQSYLFFLGLSRLVVARLGFELSPLLVDAC